MEADSVKACHTCAVPAMSSWECRNKKLWSYDFTTAIQSAGRCSGRNILFFLRTEA